MERIPPSRPESFFSLVFALALCITAGRIAAQFSPGPWYDALVKPDFIPPNWVFGPIWAVLYVSMGAAVWHVWYRRGLTESRWAMSAFLFQLMLNTYWSFLFFELRRPDLAFLEIMLLGAMILITIVLFLRHSAIAGLLMVPYLGWVAFAALLNYELWKLNA